MRGRGGGKDRLKEGGRPDRCGPPVGESRDGEELVGCCGRTWAERERVARGRAGPRERLGRDGLKERKG
jgi:hypothetical protein